MANGKREIKIRCDFAGEVRDLFAHFSSQLSDGYWENSRGEWGSYEDGYYEDIWNCFEFKYNGDFVIVLKDKPTWPDAKKDCKKFHAMTDKEIADYLRTALFEALEDAPCAFGTFSDRELEVLEECIKNWEIILPSPPKMTHEKLVKIVGHDFE